jgi:hypothetical protein
MTAWTSNEINTIGGAEELALAARRADGTLRHPVTIWVVRHGYDLYVRAFKGPNGRWFRDAREGGVGRIRAGGVEREVAFVAEPDPAINDALDADYRTKYRRFDAQYVDPMVTPAARAATLKLVPDATTA